ncbi:MAG: hypothetical protein ABI389_04010 [Rhodanobacter sp.]
MQNPLIELDNDQIEQVSGGLVFIPVVVGLVKGFAWGVGAATAAYTAYAAYEKLNG